MKFFSLGIILLTFSCTKSNSTNPVDIKAKFQNTWTFISETRTGTFNERYTPPVPGGSKIKFDINGNAYSNLEGQSGLVYPYNLNLDDKTINYKFIFFLPMYTTTNIQSANIQSISDNLLVLQNTFRSGNYSVTLVDSLMR